MRRILVTGARGFLGRHVTARLTARGAEVHAVSSGLPPKEETCVWHQANLLDAVDRRALIARVRPSALIHLAWCAKPPNYWSDPDNVRWVSATLDLALAFAEQGGARMVAAGTCAEYDWRHHRCTERRTPLAPTTLYGTAKAACGEVLDAYGRASGLAVAWGRLFFVFGPHDSPLRLVPSIVRDLRAGREARCVSGAHVRDFLHVDDAASALVALLESQVTGPVNIASGEGVRLADVARHIATAVGRPDLLTIEEGAHEDAVLTADVTRLRDEVGWRPEMTLSAGLRQTVAWWCSAAEAEVRL